MTDEQIAALLARSHAAFVATIMDALQLDWAPPVQTGRPVVERCEVVRPVVERREVVRPVVERCEVATCEVVERCEVVRQEVATCQVVVRPEVAACQVVVRQEVATCQVVVRPEVATCQVVVRPEVATCQVVVRPEVVSLEGDTGEGSESVCRVVSLEVEVERCRRHLHWLRPPNLVGMEANAYCWGTVCARSLALYAG